MPCSHGTGITACRSRWETREDINDRQSLWNAFKAHSTSTCSPFIGRWWSDCCNMSPKNTTGVCGAGRIADVGLAGSPSTSGETRFVGSVTLSDACGQMRGTMHSSATGGYIMTRERDTLNSLTEL